MLIATFGPTTAWAGKSITYENGLFSLEGLGPLSAADVLAHDSQGHISWAYAGLREWVQRMAAGGASNSPVAPLGKVSQTKQRRRRVPVWIIALLALVAVAVIVTFIGVVVKPARDEDRREAAVRAGIYTIAAGIQAWSADNNGAYPDASLVNSSALAAWVSKWPTNPYTGLPMTPGGGPGNFSYANTADATSYLLVGIGKDYKEVIKLP